ncbi:hypothetical protein IWX92DRAFT_11220 [Phyllosticta citricarpa]
MFEKSNPPDSPEAGSRGRSFSPSGSVRSRESSARNGSRVRASFISVEGIDPIARMAQMTQSTMSPTSHPGEFEGPQDIPANDAHPEGSTAAHRRGSMSLDPKRDSNVLEEVRQSVTQEARERRTSLQVDEVVPEQAVAPSTLNTPFPEIKEDEAMGNFVDNADNKLQDPELSNTPGPKQEATQENADKAVADAAKNLRKVELAVHENPRTESDTAVDDKPASMARNAQAKSEPAALIDLSEDSTDKSAAAEPAMNNKITAPKPLEAEDVQTKRQAESTSAPEEKPEPMVDLAEAKGTPVENNDEVAVEESAPPAVEETIEPPAEEEVDAVPVQETSSGGSAPEHEEPAPQEKPAESVPDSPKKSPTPVPTETPASSITSPKSTSSKTAAAPAEQPTKKTSRQSLQSTTSSTTTGPKPRSTSRPAAEKKPSQAAGTAKPRPKSPTRPAKVPSRLMQPTAASATKREDDKKATSSTTARKPAITAPRAPAVASKTTTAAAAKKPATSRPPPASSSSTKRPESQTSRASVGGKAPDDFLARMMRPTAASASKTHDKTEVKSPPRRNPVPKPKQANGEASKVKRKVVEGAEKAKDKAAAVVGKKEPETSAKLEPSAPIDDKAEPDAPADSGAAEGSETPVPNHSEDSTSMTQTPAGLEGGVIRSKSSTSHGQLPLQLQDRHCNCCSNHGGSNKVPPPAVAAPTRHSLPLRSTTPSRPYRASSSLEPTSSPSSTTTTPRTNTTTATSVTSGSTFPDSDSSTISSIDSVMLGRHTQTIQNLQSSGSGGGDSQQRKSGRISNLISMFEGR